MGGPTPWLFFLLGSCAPCSCPSGCKHAGPTPCPLESRTKVPIHEEPSVLFSLSHLDCGDGGRKRVRKKGEALEGYNLLERNVLSNTNVNMIYATPAARLFYFPDSETPAGGSYLSSIPEGDPDQSLVLLQHLKYKPQP